MPILIHLMHLASVLHICILLFLLFALLFVCLTYPTARMRLMLNVFRYPDSCWFTLEKLFPIWFEFVGQSDSDISNQGRSKYHHLFSHS